MKIFTVATVPDDLAKEWLQHLRDFDHAHPGCHFEVMADAPNMAMADMLAVVQHIKPEFDFQTVIESRDAAMRGLLDPLNTGICPDCKTGVGFTGGPRGGLSQNITCDNCGSRFNVAPRYPDHRPAALFYAERI